MVSCDLRVFRRLDAAQPETGNFWAMAARVGASRTTVSVAAVGSGVLLLVDVKGAWSPGPLVAHAR